MTWQSKTKQLLGDASAKIGLVLSAHVSFRLMLKTASKSISYLSLSNPRNRDSSSLMEKIRALHAQVKIDPARKLLLPY